MLSITTAAVVLLVPGGALLAWISHSGARVGFGQRDPVNWLVDASALSISAAALVGLAGHLLGVRFSGGLVSGLYGFCAALLIVGFAWRSLLRPVEQPLRATGIWRGLARLLFALALAGVLIGWRFYQARDLALPVWVDSVHHSLVVRVILERGGVPATLEPYLPVPLVFHYGYHLSAALFSFWSGMPADQSVLWFGQILNALVALSAYRVASVFVDKTQMDTQETPFWETAQARSFPLLAALLVGFAFQMPGYYLTWGRFTLLAGLVMLGPAVAAALDAWDNPARKDAWVCLTLLICGLALTHIFTLLLAVVFLALLGISGIVHALRRKQDWKFVWRLVVFPLLGLLLAAPWIAFTLRESPYETAALVNVTIDTSEAARQRAADYLRYLSYLTGPRRSHLLLGFAGAGLLAALIRPRRRFLAAWALLLAVSALPWGDRATPFRADYFAIILFFPAALLLAGLLVDSALALGKVTRRPCIGALVCLLLVSVLVGWGMRETRSIINPVTVIATPADARALAWVRQQSPPDARFYINSAAWQSNSYRGVDGGYWLAPFAGRASLVPPVFYVWGERSYVEQINDWARRSAEIKGCTPQFWDIVKEAKLTHVYVREGVGSLQPAGLADCSRLQEVYAAEGVHIYSIAQP